MNDPGQPTHLKFSQLAASTSAQAKFFRSLLSFMQTYGFDGVAMDWYDFGILWHFKEPWLLIQRL